MTSTEAGQNSMRPMGVSLGILAACALWSCWPTLAEMTSRWSVDPTYSHGYLVPLVAAAILWVKREQRPRSVRPAWWGLGLVALGVAMQLVGARYYIRWLSGVSLVAYLGGATALAGGWPLLRWAAPAVGFLVFMVPLPYRVDMMMQGPLRKVSTRCSGFALQTLGLPAVVEGNIILLDDVELGVVDACSGLKMFLIFFCITTAVALLLRRPLADRLLILLSTAPIAIACNVARITLTGVMHEVAGRELADLVFHDLAGWLMMPMALALLWVEVKLLDVLLVDDGSTNPIGHRRLSPLRLAAVPRPDQAARHTP